MTRVFVQESRDITCDNYQQHRLFLTLRSRALCKGTLVMQRTPEREHCINCKVKTVADLTQNAIQSNRVIPQQMFSTSVVSSSAIVLLIHTITAFYRAHITAMSPSLNCFIMRGLV
jgi:hypothetical protein